MRTVRYEVKGGLTGADVRRMHEHALSLIEKVGLQVPHEGVRRLAAQHGGVSVQGEWVRFKPDVVEQAIRQMKYPDFMWNDEIKVISGAYELSVIDLDTGEIRPATAKDLRELVKLQDSFGFYGSAPVRPTDLPQPLQELAMYKVCWENSRLISNCIFEANEKSTLQVAEYTYEMAQAAGRNFHLGLWVVSPFKTMEKDWEIIYRFLDRKAPLWCATMPVAGTTAPIFMSGAYVQSLAELFAGVTMLHVISRGSPVFADPKDSIRAYPFDMKFGAFVYGSPEDIFATLFQIQLNAFYKIPVVAKSLLTTSQLPDAHAAAEKSAHTVLAALAGARIFTNAGLLSVDEIFSAEQAVIDYEIVQYVAQLLKGQRVDKEALAVDAIQEVALAGRQFLDHDMTLEHFREAFWMPSLFEHRTLGQWRDAGSKSTRARAREIARRRIAGHEYALPEDMQREVDRIYRHAAQHLV